MHVILLLILLFGDFTHTPKPVPVVANIEPIQAVAIDKSQVEAKVQQIKKQKNDEAKRIKELERRASSAKEKRAREEKRIKDLKKQKDKADKAAKAAKAKAVAAEKERKIKEAEKQKAEKAASTAKANRLKEEAAAKKAQEIREKRAEEKKRQEQAAKETAEQERLLAEQMAAEMASRKQARRQQVMSEVDRYRALIRQSITQKLITDRSTMEGKSCRIEISIATSGFVTSVVSGKGDKVVCEAAITATYKVGTLPMSKNPDVYEELRKVGLTVAPEF